MRILGIETSCDETSAAVLEKNTSGELRILSDIISSSLGLHSKTGGIIPEIAAREQIKYIIPVIEQSLHESNLYYPSSEIDFQSSIIHPPNIDAIAVTVGPGLIGSLLVGVETAKTLSYIFKKPIIPVNHLYGHIYANWISSVNSERITVNFPALALVVSGGHTDLVLMKNHDDIRWIGGTRDDAAGECFDKCARLLGYDYPGGPKISSLAEKGNPKAYSLPRPMIGSNDLDFSFSGLKTAFMKLAKEKFAVTNKPLCNTTIPWNHIILGNSLSEKDKQVLNDLCASLEQSIIDVLIKKTLKAVKKYDAQSVLLSGGVAANQKLRQDFESSILNLKSSIKLFVPAKNLCTDNAAMIAAAAFYNYKKVPWREITANPELYFD